MRRWVEALDWQRFTSLGFAMLSRQLDGLALGQIEALFRELPAKSAGHRLAPQKLSELSAIGTITAGIAGHIGRFARPVRALLFDKRAENNWALGWHQDRTIEVKARIDTEGFGPWTIKSGRTHVAPPMPLLESMMTVRIHLDDVDADNAPLLVAPGSHRLGLVPERDIAAVVQRCGIAPCLARRGQVWVYATPILHASDAASNPRRRRVLQIDFGATHLPNGLEWAATA